MRYYYTANIGDPYYLGATGPLELRLHNSVRFLPVFQRPDAGHRQVLREQPMNAHIDPTDIHAPMNAAPGSGASGGGQQTVSQPAIVASVLAADAITIFLCGLASGMHWLNTSQTGWTAYILIVAGATGLALAGLRKSWTYTIPSLSSLTRQIALTGAWMFLAVAALIVLNFIIGLPGAYLKPWLAMWFATGWGIMAAVRCALRIWLAKQSAAGTLARRTVIAGGGEAAATLVDQLKKSANTDIRILGLFDDRGDDRSPDNVGGIAKLGNFEELADFCRNQKIDLIIVALPAAAEERILHLLNKLWVLPIDIRVSAHNAKLKLRERAYTRIGNVPFLPVFDKPMSDWGGTVKTIEDRTVAALALVLLAPLFAVVALAIKMNSKGPVFFRQIRYGFNNEPIHILKFRSMYTDQCDARATKLVTKDDPRVTSVGRIIRKTSIDELPQLINVLKGDLSLVGLRPHAFQAKAGGTVYDKAVDGYFARHKMKPGITGWAQVNGWRGETDTLEKIEQRVAHDLYYIDNWSLFLDI